MFTPAPRTPHVGIVILSPDLHPKQMLYKWMESLFKETHLQGLNFIDVDAVTNSGMDKLLDVDKFKKALPNIDNNKKVFLDLSIPSPSGTRYPGGSMMEHANTILIDPEKKEIRINEPIVGATFSPKLIKALEEKYPDYKIIDEQWKFQKPGETICTYVAAKVAQHYHTGNPSKITRQSIEDGWKEDVKLFCPTKNFTPSIFNLYELIGPLADEVAKQCILYIHAELKKHGIDFSLDHLLRPVEDSCITWIFNAFGYGYKRHDEDGASNLDENRGFDQAIKYFSECFVFHCDLLPEGKYLSGEGKRFYEEIWPAYKIYFDHLIKEAGFTPGMSSDEAREKFNAYLNTHELSEDSALKAAVTKEIHACIPQVSPRLG